MKPLARSLAGSLSEAGVSRLWMLAQIVQDWPEIVGRALAIHTTPVDLQAGVLWVAADHALFAAQLRELGRDILRALRRRLRDRELRALRVVIAPERVRIEAVASSPPPLRALSLRERKQAARIVRVIRDRELKRALYRAITAQMRASRFQASGNGAEI